MADPRPTALTAPAVAAAFRRRFPAAANDLTLAFAPGRVNLIGDHVDYCGGQVLPMPIQFGTWVAAAANGTDTLRAASHNQPDAVCVDLGGAPASSPGHWGGFVRGAAAVLQAQDTARPTGADVYVAGDIPASGLSSSASLSVALLLALGRIMAAPLAGLPLAVAAQRIEHEHVGVSCGLMDQAAVVLGSAGAALLFDCAEQAARSIPLPEDACAIVVADTGVPRSLATSAYNERRAALHRAAEALGLGFATLARHAPADAGLADPELNRLIRHVAGEQRRVAAAAAALGRRDWATFGELLQQSHASLRDDYRVSCPELDTLADAFTHHPACYGARMTGAGFGGAVVAAVRPEQLDACLADVAAAYGRRYRTAGRMFVATALGGARLHG